MTDETSKAITRPAYSSSRLPGDVDVVERLWGFRIFPRRKRRKIAADIAMHARLLDAIDASLKDPENSKRAKVAAGLDITQRPIKQPV